jgi:hypothetical protein
MQAKELQDHLTGVLASYTVNVLSGHDYVEVRPKGCSKGAVLALIMERLEGRQPLRQQQQQQRLPTGSAADSFAPPVSDALDNAVDAAERPIRECAGLPPSFTLDSSVSRSDAGPISRDSSVTPTGDGKLGLSPRPLGELGAVLDGSFDRALLSALIVRRHRRVHFDYW